MPVDLSVIIPVFNSESILGLLMKRLIPILEAEADRKEVILINDGSRDRSWDIIRQLAQEYPDVRGIHLMRNYGQHNALLAGIRQARYDTIITMDDDLQNLPEEIPKLLGKLQEGYDVVYGIPESSVSGLRRALASRVTKLVLKHAMGAEIASQVTAFRAIRAHVREAFASYDAPFVSIDVLLTWGATSFGAVRTRFDRRRIGTSHYTWRRLVTHALNLVTGFNVWPLQFASVLGLGCTLFGLLLLIYVLGRYVLEGGSVPGFPFLACIISIFSGAQLFTLGIMGEYLSRMHFRSMGQPAYVVRSTTASHDATTIRQST